jgi:hypothetical protein
MNHEPVDEGESEGESHKTQRVDTGRPTTLSARARRRARASSTDRVALSAVLTIILAVASAAYWAGVTREKVDTQNLHFSDTHAAPSHVEAEMQVPSRMPTPPPGAMPQATVTSPNAGTRVSRAMTIEGRTEGVPQGWDVWLVTRREAGGDVFPKQRVTLMPDGSFEKKIWDHGENGEIWVCVLIAQASETKRFSEWLNEGARTKKFPALALHDEKSKLLTCQKLLLEDATPQ